MSTGIGTGIDGSGTAGPPTGSTGTGTGLGPELRAETWTWEMPWIQIDVANGYIYKNITIVSVDMMVL